MRKFFIILLTLVMLTGCGQLPNDVSEDEHLNMPDIVFMERVYNDNDGFISIAFTDSNGDCYTSADREVCSLDFEKLIEEYKSGGLDDRITQKGYYNTDGLRENYEKLCNAVRHDDCDIVYPEMLPDVETESYSWYGLYYNENHNLKSKIIHANERMTSLYSANDNINGIYKWYTDSYIADSTVSVNMPDIVFLKRVYNDDDGFIISVAFTDSNGDCYTSADKEVCGLAFAELVDKYKSGSLDGKITKSGSYSPEELRSNYEKLCNAVRHDNCDIVYPEMLPDVETESYSWYGLYYDENHNLKSQIIHENECETGLDSNSDVINEIYKWYAGNYIAVNE